MNLTELCSIPHKVMVFFIQEGATVNPIDRWAGKRCNGLEMQEKYYSALKEKDGLEDGPVVNACA